MGRRVCFGNGVRDERVSQVEWSGTTLSGISDINTHEYFSSALLLSLHCLGDAAISLVLTFNLLIHMNVNERDILGIAQLNTSYYKLIIFEVARPKV